MRKFWRLLLTAILLCIVVMLPLTTGCQIKETPPSPVPTPSPREPGVLNLWDSGPITLDPAISSEMTSHAYVMQFFSGLAYLDTDSKPAPDIAESWEISPDGTVYTFHIRKGVMFHSGRELTAHDFKYSWERACNPATNSQTAITYLGDIVGVKDMLESKATEISGIKIIDDYTLEVTIDAPKAYFLAKMTYPTAFVVDKTNVESGAEWWHKPSGTGPFKLIEWKTDEVLILEPNESYYRKPVNIERIVFHLLAAGMPMALYETGKIDVTTVYEYYIARVTDESGPFYQELAIFPELSLTYIGFNTQKPPFDDINVRKAFCHAIDKEQIIRLARKGMETEANGILPPNMPGYNENLSGLHFDIAEAKNLIAHSKYGDIANLPPITITDSGYGGNIPEYLGAIIQDWQQNLGVEVSVRQLEPESFLYGLKQEADEMYTFGWIADYTDPQDFLDILFHSDVEYNYGKYSNPDVDSLLEQAGIESNEATRFSLYQQAEQIIIDEAACLPLWFGTNYVLIKPYVKNYKLDAHGIPSLSEVYIAE